MSSTIRRLHEICARDGLVSLTYQLKDKIRIEFSSAYQRWFYNQAPSEPELRVQRETVFEKPLLISVVTAVYNTEPRHLRELADSLLIQTYDQWEACFYDGGSTRADTCAELDHIGMLDSRFHVQKGTKNEGISGNTNHALNMATGEYVAFCDHDDILTPDALFVIRRAIDRSGALLIYSDEDKIRGNRLFDGHLKPDFSPEMLEAGNYFCHLTVASLALVRKIGDFRSDFDGSQDYDFVLRAWEKTTRIAHIPRVLYHWRMHSVSASHQFRERCAERAAAALQEHLRRIGESAVVSRTGDWLHVDYMLEEHPLLSVILWRHDGKRISMDLLSHLVNRTAYRPLEIIVEGKTGRTDKLDGVRVRQIDTDQTQAVSKRLNVLAREAEGTILCFLHGALQPENPRWAETMLKQAQRRSIGAVTSLICSKSGKIHYAGYVIGRTHVAASALQGFNRYSRGYLSYHRKSHNVSAASCHLLMLRREIWLSLGGLNEKYCSELADVDFCQRMQGVRVVFAPDAVMIRHGGIALYDEQYCAQEEDDYAHAWGQLVRDAFYNEQFALADGAYRLNSH